MTIQIPLQRQLELYDRFKVESLYAIKSMIDSHGDEIMAMARDRLVEGFDLYGDEMWFQATPETMRETMEELADAVNRLVKHKAQLHGRLPRQVA
jgi:hypothetical protein